HALRGSAAAEGVRQPQRPARRPGERSDQVAVGATDATALMATAPGSLTPRRFVAPDATDEVMEIQMGPSHPASHGTIKFNLRLDGETIVDIDVEIAHLHRGFEKMDEQGTLNH